MQLNLVVDGAMQDQSVFLGWTPRRVTLSVSNIPAGVGPIPIQVKSTGATGRLVFTLDRATRGQNVLNLTVSQSNPQVAFFVAGEFGFPSVAKNDAEMTATIVGTAPVIQASQYVTIRIRKNANNLLPDERDRFLFALAKVNDQGLGPFQAIRDMHKDTPALIQAHQSQQFGNAHFLPWHRAYLLDLERHLQNIDPSVALPYWKFDVPAPNVFVPDFMGTANNGAVNLNPTNPLIGWRTDSGFGISRSALFNQATQSPFNLNNVDSEAMVLGYGGAGRLYSRFTTIEANSHNGAHGSFDFDLSTPQTAPRDPVFFLLHTNVDRLWAHWQWLWNRSKKTSSSSYTLQGKSALPNDVGRMTQDTMWPWDGVTGGNRPLTVPRAGLPASPSYAAPGVAPTIESMIDYQGKLSPKDEMGFDYEEVPYWN